MAGARYPLSVENVGEDTYILMSRGHHDVHEFMRSVRADGYTWPLGMPTHEWMRAIPAPKGSGYRCLYVEAKPGARGAFPAAYAREAYNEDRYEALVTANGEVTSACTALKGWATLPGVLLTEGLCSTAAGA